MRTHAIVVVFGAMGLCLGCASGWDGATLVEQYVELHRRGDVDGLLAMHTEDAEFLIPGQVPIRGSQALRNVFEWDAVLGSELVMEGVNVEGNTITVERVIERNRLFEALGVPEVRYRPGTRLVVLDGLVSGVYPTGFTEETESLVMGQFSGLFQWLSVNHPEFQEELLPEGKFRYDASSAQLWLQVIEDWNRAKR